MYSCVKFTGIAAVYLRRASGCMSQTLTCLHVVYLLSFTVKYEKSSATRSKTCSCTVPSQDASVVKSKLFSHCRLWFSIFKSFRVDTILFMYIIQSDRCQ